ncbi:MAG TPA: PEP-CTERM sorting domain-containing protein, partial [Vicinamibacteria bacterium]
AGNGLQLFRQIETSPGHFANAFLTGVITSVVPSPPVTPAAEPASLLLMATGLAVVSFLSRRAGG